MLAWNDYRHYERGPKVVEAPIATKRDLTGQHGSPPR